jgi:hypothetical protein
MGKGVVVETDRVSLSVGLWCASAVDGHHVGTVERHAQPQVDKDWPLVRVCGGWAPRWDG